ncbi:MAG: HlyD family secretion protein [Nitrospira sp.]|nr:HlyD family secretion protein [Nitrospira sp.]
MEETKTEEVKQNNNNKKKYGFIVLAIVVLIGAVTLFFYLRYKATHISTDDAFIDGDIHTIASKVTGTVRNVHVKSNQFVKRGDILVELDMADYEAKLNETSSIAGAEKAKLIEVETKIKVSQSKLAELSAALAAAKANIELQEANLRQAENDSRRAENLFKSGTISKDRYEKTMTAYAVNLARLKAAKEQVKQVEKELDTQKDIVKQTEASRTIQISTIKEKEAKKDIAQLNYGYTKIYAPVDGYVTKKSVELGNQIKDNQPLMAIVSLDGIHITANYKETQLEKIKLGQKVRIKVDSYSGKTFWGKVDSIMAGTGASFSLFPAENATGNYVKVVQRIPVKIVLDADTDKDHVLRIGMSVVPTIIVE